MPICASVYAFIAGTISHLIVVFFSASIGDRFILPISATLPMLISSLPEHTAVTLQLILDGFIGAFVVFAPALTFAGLTIGVAFPTHCLQAARLCAIAAVMWHITSWLWIPPLPSIPGYPWVSYIWFLQEAAVAISTCMFAAFIASPFRSMQPPAAN